MIEQTDGELILLYRDKQDQQAMRKLVERHYDRIYRRFSRELRNEADAQDLSQKLWLQVARNLENYNDEGKFPQFLSTIATNLIKEHWRQTGTRSNVIVETEEIEEVHDLETDHGDPERKAVNDEMITLLTRELIPSLPSDQRMAWLLRHESEYWEPGQRLEWQHIAELNGIDVMQAWDKFESARSKFMSSKSPSDPDQDEMLIFLVWTQAQRALKEQRFSWDYFSDLLGVPVNTMKTRYRSAQQRLAEALESYRSTSHV